MEFACLGLSHKSAPLSVREKLALSSERQEELLLAVADASTEAMLLSTCNRVEFYLAGPSLGAALSQVKTQIAALGGAEAAPHLYSQQGEAALVHLFRVAASLDSMVVGEPQILGQVKDAFELAKQMGAARAEMSRTCAAAFSSAKRVRSETGVGKAATSMASAAVELAKKVFGPLEGTAVLVVGAGEMAEAAAKHLRSAGASRLWVANRTLARAEEVAQRVGGVARSFDELPQLLTLADVVITSTAAPTPILTRENVGNVLKARKYRRLLMVDLAVPRDIEPEVNGLENIYVFNVDDIQNAVSENSAARAQEANKAEAIVAEEVACFVRSKAVREGMPVLARLRAQAEQIKRAELQRAFANLKSGASEEELKKGFEALATALVNKLLHQPTARLRAVGADEEGTRLAGAVAELFGLEGLDEKLAKGGRR